MRNINIIKIANIVSIFLMIALIVTPLVVGAQGFRIPSPGGTNLPGDDTATGFILRIIDILLGVAALVAVIFLIVGGFRYIMAGGNEEAAAGAKKTILNAIIGIVVIILAFVIVRVVSNALISSQF